MSLSLSSPSGSVSESLAAYQAEREILLRSLQSAAESDARIAAVWLFGSLGRKDEDELSDIDIVFVVQNAHLKAVIAERYTFMKRIGDLILVEEAPQNAPPGGAYNMAVYAAPVSPHTVDCYWQPVEGTCVPPQSLLLFDRVGLPVTSTARVFGYQPVPETSPVEAVNRSIQFFWVMILITAKYVGRSPFEERMGLLQWVFAPLADCERFVSETPAFTLETAPAHAEPLAKTRLLRDLIARMDTLTPLLSGRGAETAPAMPANTRRYLDFIESVAAVRPRPADPAEPARG